MAATATVCQSIWIRNVMQQVIGEEMCHVTLYIDNKSTIDLAKKPVFHERSKYIDICYHFICDCIERGEIVVKYIAGESRRTNILIKALFTIKFERMRQLQGIKDVVGPIQY